MLKVELYISADCSIEDNFFNMIENNEICTVQADLEKNEHGIYEITLVPQFEEDYVEFLELVKEVIEFLDQMGYNRSVLKNGSPC